MNTIKDIKDGESTLKHALWSLFHKAKSSNLTNLISDNINPSNSPSENFVNAVNKFAVDTQNLSVIIKNLATQISSDKITDEDLLKLIWEIAKYATHNLSDIESSVTSIKKFLEEVTTDVEEVITYIKKIL